jgi:hypothetical protein
MRSAALRCAAAAGLFAGLCSACSASGFPDPAPCASPTSVPSPPPQGNRRDISGDFRYRQTLFLGADQLTKLVADFRLRWPDGKFSRDSSFRSEFARYADQTRCLAAGLRALTPPGVAYADFVVAFQGALDRLVAAVGGAREGVKSRNVSDYRDWNTSIDGRIAAVRESFAQLPATRGP